MAASDRKSTFKNSAGGKKAPTGKKGVAARVAEVVKAARDEFQLGNLETSQQLLLRGLEISPNDPDLLDALAEVFLEMGSPELAHSVLLKSIEAAPEAGWGKYFYLAQLTEGLPAVDLYQDGLHLLTTAINAAVQTTAKNLPELLNERAHALSSIAELFMSDLSGEDDAQEKCHAAVEGALADAPESPVVLHTAASFYLVTLEGDKAREAAHRGASVWFTATPDKQPDMEFKISVAKLMVDLGLFEWAVALLKIILVADPNLPECWYVAALTCHYIGDVEGAEEAMKGCVKSMKKHSSPELREHLGPLVQQLGELLAVPEQAASLRTDIAASRAEFVTIFTPPQPSSAEI